MFNEKDLSNKEVYINSLDSETAIGKPTYCDYALLKGKEQLLQAEVDGYIGQAFTDRPGYYKGNLKEVFALPLSDNFQRAIFIATLNALLRKQGAIQKSIHCRGESPASCALLLSEYIKTFFKPTKVVLIGYQPRFAETLAESFLLRINDLDNDNIGKKVKDSGINEVCIESSSTSKENVDWGDLIVVTGSAIVNNTFSYFFPSNKPVLFFGTSIVGPAQLLGLNHFCPLSS
ncbi:MAG: DUF364 domain-containing protein [Bacillota bacterium]